MEWKGSEGVHVDQTGIGGSATEEKEPWTEAFRGALNDDSQVLKKGQCWLTKRAAGRALLEGDS